MQSQWNSLTRLTKLSVQLCCVGRQRCFVNLSSNQLKISDVGKILFCDLFYYGSWFYLSLLEPCEKTFLLCGAESKFWVNLCGISILYENWSIRDLKTLHS